MKKVLIIAEAGVNHNGNINLAKRLIDEGKKAGVDYVKFQTWITEELVDESAPKAQYQKENDGENTSQFQMLKKLELSFDEFKELKRYSEQVGVGFLSTPDEEKSLNFLADELHLPILKVGSGEVTNIPFLIKIGAKKKDVILSSGMSTLAETKRAYTALLEAGAKSVAVLHCTSNYPAAYNSVNLKAMGALQQELKTTIGYSDHTQGVEVSVAAVALGAKIIEKHFTLDKNMEGPDHKASISPIELATMVRQIRNVEQAISGSGKKEPTRNELETKKVVAKGLYWAIDKPEGEKITANDLVAKRPVKEISVEKYHEIIDKKTTEKVKKGEPLTWNKIG